MWKDDELKRILDMEIGSTIVLRSTYNWEILIEYKVGGYTAVENNYRCSHVEQSRKTFKVDKLDKLFEIIDEWV